MNVEEWQKTWKSQLVPAPQALDLAAPDLLATVRKRSRDFDRTIWWRDVREIGIGLILLPLCAVPRPEAPGSPLWQILSLGLLASVIAFMWIVRIQTQRRRSRFPATLLGELDWSIFHVRRQIWLLGNVWWWYLLPLFLSIVSLRLYVNPDLVDSLGYLGVCAALAVVIYGFNLVAVKFQLRPQLDELLAQRDQWQRLSNSDAL